MAALVAWHDAHEDAKRHAAGACIPAHARLETYSVLTRLPPPHRLAPTVVSRLLERSFPSDRTLVPSAGEARAVVDRCSRIGVAGGAVYDALVALTAAEAGLPLVTRDRRAARTYDLLDITFDVVV